MFRKHSVALFLLKKFLILFVTKLLISARLLLLWLPYLCLLLLSCLCHVISVVLLQLSRWVCQSQCHGFELLNIKDLDHTQQLTAWSHQVLHPRPMVTSDPSLFLANFLHLTAHSCRDGDPDNWQTHSWKHGNKDTGTIDSHLSGARMGDTNLYLTCLLQ